MIDTRRPYQREELGADGVRFIVGANQLPGPTGGDTSSRLVPAIVGIVAFVIAVTFLNFIIALVVGIGAAYAVQRLRANRPGGNVSGTYTFTVGRSAVTAAGGRSVPVTEVGELVWRDWSADGEPSQCSLFIETRAGESIILATNMDRATVEGLAAEVARLLGVQVSGGKPERAAAAPAAVTASGQGFEDGDLILAETEPGRFEIQRVTGGGRELVEPVPPAGLVETIEYARRKAGERNLWLAKLADQGPAVLVPKPKTA